MVDPGRESLEIEPCFSKSDDFRVLRQFAELGAEILGRFLGGAWMPAYRGINLRMLIGQGEDAPAAGGVRADGDDAYNPGSAGAVDDLGEVRLEIGVIEMGVGI